MGFFFKNDPASLRELCRAGACPSASRPRVYPKPYTRGSTLHKSGLRFYSPELRRWLSRDPVEEEYHASLYVYVENDVSNSFDGFGDETVNPNKDAKQRTRRDLDVPGTARPADWLTPPGLDDRCEFVKSPVAVERADLQGRNSFLQFKAIISGPSPWIRELRFGWMTCIRGQEAGWIPRCENKMECNVPVMTCTPVTWTPDYITQLTVRWLSCDECKWTLHQRVIAGTYTCEGLSFYWKAPGGFIYTSPK